MRYLILMTALVTGACNAPSEKSPSVDADVVIDRRRDCARSGAFPPRSKRRAGVRPFSLWICGPSSVAMRSMSHGGLCIVDTPVQKAQGVSDSADNC